MFVCGVEGVGPVSRSSNLINQPQTIVGSISHCNLYIPNFYIFSNSGK